MGHGIETTSALRCWVVTDGKAGTETQCVGLAAAMGLQPIVKRIQLRAPWRWLTPYLRGLERFAFSRKGDALQAPWPNVLIASGRRSLPAAFAARAACGTKIFLIQLQNPHCDLRTFNLVRTPEQGGLTGPNVRTTRGGLHKQTPETIAAAAETQRSRFSSLPSPYAAVLIGGTSRAYDFTKAALTELIANLKKTLQAFDGSLLLTPSRRTPHWAMAQLNAAFGVDPRVWLWDGTGANPYPALLGLGDWTIATADSVSMISEACTNGKPVYVAALPGGTQRFDRFHAALRARGHTRPFTGALDHWHSAPLLETQRVAALALQKLTEHLKANHHVD